MVKQTYAGLQTELQQAKDAGVQNISILLHDNPDPDALAGGFFLQREAEQMGFTTTVNYGGSISRPENIVMAKKLGMPTKHTTDLDPESIDRYILFDHSGNTSELYRSGKIPDEKVLAVIDHHDLDKPDPAGSFIHKENVGSASTLLAEYLQDGASEKYDSLHLREISTALLLGVRADTRGLLKASPRDVAASNYLMEHANLEDIQSIENTQWDPNWLTHIGHALNHMYQDKGIVVASAGHMKKEDQEVVPEIAEMFMRTRGIHTAYVFSIQPDEIKASLRTSDPAYKFEDMNERFLPGSGGGREGAGGLVIPNPFEGNLLGSTEDSFVRGGSPETIEDLIFKEFKQRVFER
jgi:nanoRNase/pAp phosphatase (c-di-AMP/oligoRNAs hydrolase)